MPKKNKRSKKKKLKLTEVEKILTELHKVVRGGQADAQTANSLIRWYMTNKFWTEKQWCYAKSLVARQAQKGTAKPAKWYLYAIRAGRDIKLGYSKDPQKRMKAMQTGQSRDLTIDWKFYTGRCEKNAKQLEKKLHRFCSKYAIRGEWFSDHCMILVNQFSIKEKIERDFINEQQEEAIAMEASKYI